MTHDPVNHPSHYTSHPSGIETIEIAETLGFCLGNAFKYIARAGLKEGVNAEEDYAKAVWYLERRIDRVKGAQPPPGSQVQLQMWWSVCGLFATWLAAEPDARKRTAVACLARAVEVHETKEALVQTLREVIHVVQGQDPCPGA